jgi:hypothetical protein
MRQKRRGERVYLALEDLWINLKVKIVDSKRLEGMGIGGSREGDEQMKQAWVLNETGCSRGV